MNIKAITVLSTLTISSIAIAQHADLLLIRDDAGNLLTGQYDFDSNQVISNDTRVFEGEFDLFGTSDEPGFNALSGSNIPAGYQALDSNSAVSFNANAFTIGTTTANLYHWDGNGPVNFTQASNALTISKAPSAIFSSTLDASASDIAGFGIDTTSSDGFLHKHIDAALSDISSSAEGFYLWSLSLEINSDSTQPIYFVHGFGTEDEEAHEAATDWVSSNIVPAPSTLALLIGLPAITARRR